MLLLYSRHCSGSVEWARYLHKLFTELSRNKSRLTVRHLPVEVLYKYYYHHNIYNPCMTRTWLGVAARRCPRGWRRSCTVRGCSW